MYVHITQTKSWMVSGPSHVHIWRVTSSEGPVKSRVNVKAADGEQAGIAWMIEIRLGHAESMGTHNMKGDIM